MNRTLILAGAVVILLSATQGASAFSTRPVDPATASDRLADPDELDVERAIRRNDFRAARQPETSVFGTTVERHRE